MPDGCGQGERLDINLYLLYIYISIYNIDIIYRYYISIIYRYPALFMYAYVCVSIYHIHDFLWEIVLHVCGDWEV